MMPSLEHIKGFKTIYHLDQNLGKILENPERSMQKITRIVNKITDAFLSGVEDEQKAKKFFKNVVWLYQESPEFQLQESLKQSIEKLQTVLVSHRLLSAPKSIESTICARIKQKLLSLDLENNNFSFEIREVDKLLDSALVKGEISSKESAILKKSIDVLKDERYFKCPTVEAECWDIIGSFSPVFQTALKEAQASTRLQNIDKDGRMLFLKCLQDPQTTLQQLACKIPSDAREIKRQLALNRLDSIILLIRDLNHPFQGKFSKNFLLLIKAMNSFKTKIAIPCFEARWQIVRDFRDSKTAMQFSQVIAYYPYMNPTCFYSDFCLIAEQHYLSGLKLTDLTELNSIDFKKMTEFFNKEASDVCVNVFNENYKMILSQRHNWLAENIPFIRQYYNQDEHADINQGSGTCAQNSLERYKLLIHNPSIDGKEIPMGSSEKGRRIKATLQQAYQQSKKELLSREEILQMYSNSSQELGLRAQEHQPIVYTNIEQLMQKIDSHRDNFLVILGCNCSSPDGVVGHMINLQINHRLKIFRMIDDNLGVCEWNSYEKMRDYFADFLRVFYFEPNEFTLTSYDQI